MIRRLRERLARALAPEAFREADLIRAASLALGDVLSDSMLADERAHGRWLRERIEVASR